MNISTNRILLLGWDAADWKVINPLLERGEMPHLAKLIERGVMGNLATLRPALSPMLWTSIVTGKRADKHGILGFVEPHPEGKGMRPISSHCRTCKALWNILTDHDMPSAFVGWFASQPAEIINGTIVTNLFPHAQGTSFDEWPLPPGCISPESKRDLFNLKRAVKIRVSRSNCSCESPRLIIA
jgi:predicted AlkP superfamily phosphohydrolase/phosphomutase